MTQRILTILSASLAAASIVIAAATISSVTTGISADLNNADARTTPSRAEIIIDNSHSLSAPESLGYTTVGTSVTIASTASEVFGPQSITLPSQASGAFTLSDDIITQASMHASISGFPGVDFTMDGPCFLSKSGSIARGILTMDGFSESMNIEVILSAHFDPSGENGEIVASMKVPDDMSNTIPALSEFADGTFSFTLEAHRNANDPGLGFR